MEDNKEIQSQYLEGVQEKKFVVIFVNFVFAFEQNLVNMNVKFICGFYRLQFFHVLKSIFRTFFQISKKYHLEYLEMLLYCLRVSESEKECFECT